MWPVEDEVEHNDGQLVLNVLVGVAVTLGLCGGNGSYIRTGDSGAYALRESHVAATKLLDEVTHRRSALDAAWHARPGPINQFFGAFKASGRQ